MKEKLREHFHPCFLMVCSVGDILDLFGIASMENTFIISPSIISMLKILPKFHTLESVS